MPAPRKAWREYVSDVFGLDLRSLALFRIAIAVVMIRDLSPRLGQTSLPWLTPAYLEQVERWSASWRRRAGL